MSGYTIVEVDSMETALAAAKTYPFIDIAESFEVSELMLMPRLG
jgi:hypothetical protein